MKKGLIVGACFLFILIVLTSFASAGWFSGLFKKATITGHDVWGGDTCYECIDRGGEWCEDDWDGWNSFCKEWFNSGDACYYGEWITIEYDCPCPSSCAEIPECAAYECGYCEVLPTHCYYQLGDCGPCTSGKTCDYNTHTCVLDCSYPNYEITRQVDESEIGFKDTTDNGCCSVSTDCVANGDCFSSDTYYPNPLDTREALSGAGSGEYCLYNIWYNEKSSLSQAECAGFPTYTFLTRVVDASETIQSSDPDDTGCCPHATDCVFNGYYFRSAEERTMDASAPYFKGYYYYRNSEGVLNPVEEARRNALSGDGSGEFCFENIWYDEPVDADYCGNGDCAGSETFLDCLDCTAPQCTNDGECGDTACTDGVCGLDGKCSYVPKADGLSCGAAGGVCCSGTCCPGGVCCSGTCCPSGNNCCAGSCTAPACTSDTDPNCDDSQACTTDTCSNAGTCSAECLNTPKANDASCGQGLICCDGSCGLAITSCSDGNPCTTDSCSNPGKCSVACSYPPIGDGGSCGANQICCSGSCCASEELCCGTPGTCATPSCTSLSSYPGTINDCKTYTCNSPGECGANWVPGNKADNVPCTSVTGGVCHDGICAKPSCSSNSDCDDSIPCTTDTCSNPGDWNADCNNVDITTCIDNDDCCPSGCNSDTDNDCSLHCGDGTSNYGETCITCPADVSCASGEYCNPTTELCVSGCGNDADCSGATPKCSASHVCVECVNAATDCAADEVCTNGNCVIGMCGYNVIDGAHFVFSVAADRARAAKFMKNIQAECGVTFEAEISNTLPTGYSVPTGQKNILILNITVSDPTSINGADLSFTINQSELITQAISEVIIYVEDDTETIGWKSLVPGADISAVSGSLEMFNYKVTTPHFSLFLITEPELCGNGDFDSAHEECDASTGVTHCTGCVCDTGYVANASGFCIKDKVGTECSPEGDEYCEGSILYECGSDLKWDKKGIVLGKCGVECYPVGNMSCQGEIPLRCGTDYQWDLQSRVSGLCGYVLDPLGGGGIPGDRCGNGYCNYDEDEFSCPEDCAPESGGDGEPNWGLIALVVGIVILVLVIIIVLFKIFNKERRSPMPPNRRLPPAHRPGPKREPGRPVEHNQPVGRPAVGQGAYPKRRYPAR